jgi:hypothetical protein
MFNEAQLAIIKRAMTALAEREMHMNNVVSDDVAAFIEELNAPVAVEEAPAPKARKSKAATSEEE